MAREGPTCEEERQQEYLAGHGLRHLDAIRDAIRDATGGQTRAGDRAGRAGAATLEQAGLPLAAGAGARPPAAYLALSPPELDERIAAAKARLGTSLVILGHHYQRDENVRFADFRGDSFKLSQQAASRKDADYIVFCGVHFMAETADILSGPHQQVILPNLEAGCSMADMADLDAVEECWTALTAASRGKLVPVTYMNSAANLKAFCGERDGIVCTSSNAPRAFEWAFEHGERILFFPDEHLGRNSAVKLGIDPAEVVVWDPQQTDGGLGPNELASARIVLWKGYCSVHMRFDVEQIREARARYPDVRVIVHPECRREVVAAADCDGSTEYIAKVIAEAPAGTTWAVGTEINLVNRLAHEHPDKRIFCLNPIVCPCSTMYRIHPAHLLWMLEALVEGRVLNRIQVAPEIARWARVALDRMLTLA